MGDVLAADEVARIAHWCRWNGYVDAGRLAESHEDLRRLASDLLRQADGKPAAKALRDALAGVVAGPQATPPLPEVPNCGNPDCPGYEHTHGHVHDPFAYECGEDVGPWVKHHHCTPRVVAVPTDPTAVRVAEVRRPVPGARDMTGDVPTDHEDPTDG